jgi:3-dehydroquinate synthetase
MAEYEAVFETASSLLMAKADRASLMLFVGSDDTTLDVYAALIALLPFRGIQVALLSQRVEYGDLFHQATPSGVFELDARQAARMGMFPLHAVFGALPSTTFEAPVRGWAPVQVPQQPGMVPLPFKIGGLTLPMVTHNGTYDEALDRLGRTLGAHYPQGYYPIVSCGETCDALGYGWDLLQALQQPRGFYYTHKSGETYKRYDNYGTAELFHHVAQAKAQQLTPVIVAVGGGVNGNCIGLVAALTGSDFVEVPTTPMHYNDATTSAKKAFSLVVDDNILSKNILGAFYLPQLVYCVNECFLTISSANAHATVGEATKTMNMLGVANCHQGAQDYHNILGAHEFASDFTKILLRVSGFESLVSFITCPVTRRMKGDLITLGGTIRSLRAQLQKLQQQQGEGEGEGECVALSKVEQQLTAKLAQRAGAMEAFRARFHALPAEQRQGVKEFLTCINKEIVSAKAMFLAYSDPFEKYRALLFEYAHTLGHGVEAFLNKMYKLAQDRGVCVPEDAFRLHGQCVGMAVLWAGQMSAQLGVLQGEGLQLHQSLVYLFNRSAGFSFQPCRLLCDSLGVGVDQFCEGVLSVVRRDNKRGYCCSSDACKSVDQLVTGRPGQMLRSADSAAELRYLVEVDEDWQRLVLRQAFAGSFDKVVDLREGGLCFVPCGEAVESCSADVASFIHSSIHRLYGAAASDEGSGGSPSDMSVDSDESSSMCYVSTDTEDDDEAKLQDLMNDLEAKLGLPELVSM